MAKAPDAGETRFPTDVPTPRGARVLMTGATGYIGRHLLEVLAPDNKVTVAGRRPPSSNASHRFATWDLREPTPGHLPQQVDLVLHLAQETGKAPARYKETLRVNTFSTVRLHEYAIRAGAGTFLYTSTGGVYGYSDHPLTEDSSARPIDYYTACKYAAELLVRKRGGPTRVVVLRYFFPYGPGQTQRLVPNLLQRIREGRPITIINGVGQPRVNPIFITDVVEATLRASMLQGDEVLNIAGTERVPMGEIARILSELVGKPTVVEHRRERAVKDLVADTTRMEKTLKFRPRISLREGLRRVVEADR